MRVTLIHNPHAGDDAQATPGQLKALIREAGHKIRVQSIKDEGWSRVLRKSADLVAVAGGDGTVGKVARRLLGSDLPIAVLPMGTANNISRTLGVAGQSVLQLIPGWEKARRVTFDAGVVETPWESRAFIEGVGLGFFPCAMPHMQTNRTLAKLTESEVKVTYALQLLRDRLGKHKAKRINASLDGKDISGEYVLFEAMNMRYIGPNLYLAPELVHNDGLFEVVCVEQKHRADLRKYLASWQDGTLWPPEFVTRRGRELELEWTGFPLHIDDKLWPGRPRRGEVVPKPPATITLRVTPKALAFLVPHATFPNPARKRATRKRRKTSRARR